MTLMNSVPLVSTPFPPILPSPPYLSPPPSLSPSCLLPPSFLPSPLLPSPPTPLPLLSTTVHIQDQLVHVGCAQYDQEVLVVALAAQRVSYQQVQRVVEETEQLLTYMYGSVHT